VEVNGTSLAYRVRGKGEPMVLVHANVSDVRSWEGVEAPLAESFRVVSYSRRYATPNAPIAAGADDPWSVHVRDLEGLIEKLGLGPVHTVGNSTGAFLALLLARRRPDLVRSLVLEEPPVLSVFLPSTPPSLGQVAKFLWSRPRAFLPIIKFGAGVIGPATEAFKRGDDAKGLETFARGVLGDAYYAKASPGRLQQMRDNVQPHKAVMLGSGLPTFLEADARAIETPTLLLQGEHTPRFQQEINHRLAELIPGAEEAVVPEASHLMHEDNPAGAVANIAAFARRPRT
jgi:pimeloyl-ACP methyl ester carboxylesterase